MSLSISPVESRQDLKRFILVSWKIYRNDPVWVPPLISERLRFLNEKKNPFFEHGDAKLFLAKKDGEIVGRISAHIDYLHNQTHHEKTGFFGFFEAINNQAVATSLLDEASVWLHRQNMTAIRGPFSFNINDESGNLVKGFEYPPYLMMGHNPPYYAELFETWGLKKKKDLFCWLYDYSQPISEVLQRAAKKARNYPGLTLREITHKSIKADLMVMRDVFNSAWKDNWGFIPLTETQMRAAAKEFKLIIEPKLALIAEIDGQAIAICIALPNLNEVLKDLDGRLFPVGIFKLFYLLKWRKLRSARLFSAGIKKEFQMSHESALAGLLALLGEENHRRFKELGILEGEGSWTLEDNQKINDVVRHLGGKHYKTYRIYERALG